MSEVENIEIEAYDEDGNLLFGVTGSAIHVANEVKHYLMQYEEDEDGPIRLERVIRVPYYVEE